MKKTYTSEQKQAIIERYISGGETYLQISEDTGIAKSTFYSWLKNIILKKKPPRKRPLIFATLCYSKTRLHDLKIWLIF